MQNHSFTNLNKNITYTDYDSALFAVGYIYPIEILYVSVFLPVTIVGVFLNIISIAILNTDRFNQHICSYFVYSCCISIIGNVTAVIHALSSCAGFNLIKIGNTFIVQWLQAFIYTPCYNMTSYALFLLDIFICLDRLAVFDPKYKKYVEKYQPRQALACVIVIVIIVNFPYLYLTYEPVQNVLVSSNGAMSVINFVRIADWAKRGSYGYNIMYVIYFVKFVLTFSVEIMLNLISLSKFREFLANKSKLVHACQIRKSMNTNELNVNMNKIKSIDVERKITKLVISNNLASFVHNVALIVYVVYYLNMFNLDLTIRVLQFTAMFVSVVRHASHFFFFYTFNSHFRSEFLRWTDFA